MSHPRYLCVHGHFYQPPRENPWLEAIERQDSAYPYHDWNERITAECYSPNAVSRILDGEGRIREIMNNYEAISFNFGPTLLHWMRDHAPDTYEAVLDADRRSAERFGGHGSAMAQCYNHLIMPLANDRDRRTQVIWGIRDFRHRFGRDPEGMWLPETAANTASLEALAEQGIAFTVLAPNQAAQVRPIPSGEPADDEAGAAGEGAGTQSWQDVSGMKVDPTRPYLCRLPSGREITLFFYDGPISRAVAFEGLLKDGDRFAGRLTDMFADGRDWPQIGHIATDGETYGHHHRHGEMALSRALRVIEGRKDIALINYAEYLAKHPPTHEARILEDTSWSCAHGVERWRSNCGCNTGGRPQWTQEWRGPLRAALDWLRDELAPRFETAASEFLADPWAARDDYIDVILDRSEGTIGRFLEAHGTHDLSHAELVRLTKLLEIQRQAMLMYTSCGWFFDELSGIETVQVIQYAGRAIQLAQDVLGEDLEPGFLDRLETAKSNLPEWGDGRQIYQRAVVGARVDLTQVGAHFAISSLFDRDTTEETKEYCYDIEGEDHQLLEAGRARLATGQMVVMSRVTKESARFTYGVIHLGDHTIQAGVRPFEDDDAFQTVRRELAVPFEAADFTEALRTLDRHFPDGTFNLRSLFQDQRRAVLDNIIEGNLRDAESAYRQIYERNAPLMRFLHDVATPLPAAFSLAGEYVLNTELIREVSSPDMDLARVRALLDDAHRREILLDTEGIGFALQGTLETLAAALGHAPDDLELMSRLRDATEVAVAAPFEVSLWTVQNAFYDLRRDHSGTVRARAAAGDEEATEWLETYTVLAERVGVAVDV